MSETEAKSPADPKILEQAAAWLTRLQSGRVTPATLEELETWRMQSEEHRTVWARAQAVLADFEQVPPGLGRDTLQRAHSGRRRAVKALALVFVAVPLGWGGYRRLPVPVREWQADYKTFKGEQKSIALSDGTQLDLNTSSAVNRVFSKNEHRIVLLAGEIRITTGAHSAARTQPLVVATAQGLMRPIGTRFSVRQLESETRLAVFAGRVAATTAASRQTLIVEAGQQVRFNRHTIAPVQAAVEDRALWEQGMLLARAMPLGELISELARYRRGILRCDPAIADMRVSGAFPVHDIDTSLALLQSSLPLEVRQLTPWWINIRQASI